MSSNRRDVDKIEERRRTSCCRTGLANLGPSARVSTSRVDGVDDEETERERVSLPNREPHKFLPSQQQVMALLSMAVTPEDRGMFRKRFQAVATDDDRQNGGAVGGAIICNTPIRWVAHAYGCDALPLQLREAGDMFPTSGTESSFLNKFYIMDVVLNRSPLSTDSNEDKNDDTKRRTGSGDDCAGENADVVISGRAFEPDDRIVMVRSYVSDDIDDKNDFKYRTMLLFLPQCGVFYCARERRGEEVGVFKSLVALDMSWLCLERVVGADGTVSYSFGEGSYVKKFYSERKSCLILENNTVSAWRVSTGRTPNFRQNRVMYRASQCCDSEGPMMPPDVYFGEEAVHWPAADLAGEYNSRLARDNSARRDGRHYAPSCHHYRLPERCWIIDPTLTHNVDLMVDVAAVGQCENRQSIVMIRNVMIIDSDDERASERYVPEWDANTHLVGALNHITFHNQVLRS